ncbi:MAG: hypothetical protein DRI79_09970 [Chloroflexi bacterium]|nr:MAG: hypothetical protein DRI79_09970 [Chloroflexota bacterium]
MSDIKRRVTKLEEERQSGDIVHVDSVYTQAEWEAMSEEERAAAGFPLILVSSRSREEAESLSQEERLARWNDRPVVGDDYIILFNFSDGGDR